mmetsp:Transcript_52189/g.136433  ORF Transcript_52189/g.136433 Transcript_52189/m.136433 type:complete len:185 (-) Transcript_52189:1670-2224(-)
MDAAAALCDERFLRLQSEPGGRALCSPATLANLFDHPPISQVMGVETMARGSSAVAASGWQGNDSPPPGSGALGDGSGPSVDAIFWRASDCKSQGGGGRFARAESCGPDGGVMEAVSGGGGSGEESLRCCRQDLWMVQHIHECVCEFGFCFQRMPTSRENGPSMCMISRVSFFNETFEVGAVLT